MLFLWTKSICVYRQCIASPSNKLSLPTQRKRIYIFSKVALFFFKFSNRNSRLITDVAAKVLRNLYCSLYVTLTAVHGWLSICFNTNRKLSIWINDDQKLKSVDFLSWLENRTHHYCLHCYPIILFIIVHEHGKELFSYFSLLLHRSIEIFFSVEMFSCFSTRSELLNLCKRQDISTFKWIQCSILDVINIRWWPTYYEICVYSYDYRESFIIRLN